MRLLLSFVALLAVVPAAARAQADVPPVIAKFKEKDPGMEKIFSDAVGYAVFPTVGKGAIGIGGARGKGWVYHGGRVIDKFTLGHLKLDAQASAIALTARASTDLAYRNGVAIVTMAKGGLMYEASVGGQKFSFTPVGK